MPDPNGAQPAAPERTFDFFHPSVVRTERLSPHLLRVVLGGGDTLARVVNGGHDQRFKLFLPRPGQSAPVLPDVLDPDWYARWRAMDPGVRGVMRTYTIRGTRARPAEIDVDFALHGDLGPASRWARRAVPGDRVSVLAPVTADNGGVDFRPPAGTDRVLLTADETALPAVAAILERLPPGMPVRAFVEVGHPDDRIPLPTKADAERHLARPHRRGPYGPAAVRGRRRRPAPGHLLRLAGRGVRLRPRAAPPPRQRPRPRPLPHHLHRLLAPGHDRGRPARASGGSIRLTRTAPARTRHEAAAPVSERSGVHGSAAPRGDPGRPGRGHNSSRASAFSASSSQEPSPARSHAAAHNARSPSRGSPSPSNVSASPAARRGPPPARGGRAGNRPRTAAR